MPTSRYTHVSRDVVQKVVSESYSERLFTSIAIGVPGGVILVVAGCGLMWGLEFLWHERERGLARIEDECVSTLACDPKNEGRIVHTTGALDGERVKDPRFGGIGDDDGGGGGAAGGLPEAVPMAIPLDAGAPRDPRDVPRAALLAGPPHQPARGLLRLRREVQMYQWAEEESSEEREKLGGGKETTKTYKYKRQWASGFNDSSKFELQRDHENPRAECSDLTVEPRWVRVGAFDVGPAALRSLLGCCEGPLPPAAAAAAAAAVWDRERVPHAHIERGNDGWYYLGGFRRLPSVGDTRVRFHGIRLPLAAPVTVLGVQRGTRLTALPAGSVGVLAATGAKTAGELVADASTQGYALKWLGRVFGAAVVYTGIRSVLDPAVQGVNIIPFLSNFVGFGAGAIALEGTALMSFASITFGWLYARATRVVGPQLRTPLRVAFGLSYGIFVGALGRKIHAANLGVAQSVASATQSGVAAVGNALTPGARR